MPELVGRGALALGQDLAHGEAVQQRLGRVLVPAVPGVDHVGPLDPARHLVRRPGRGVPDDDGVDPHGLDRLDGVAQALALLDRRAGHRQRQHVGREPLGRRLEGEPGAGRLLEEERRHHLAAQGRDLGHGAALDLGEGLRHVQDLADAVGPEVGDREEMLGAGHLSSRLPIQTPSSPTSTISSRRVREVLPHEVGPDGELAVAAVDHDGQLNGAGPTEVVQRVEGGADGAAGEEDVVDQHHHLAGQVDRDVGDRLGEDGAQPDVVAVEGHVEAADGQGVDRFDLAQDLGHFGGEGDAARLEPDEDDVVDAPVALDHLVRHARQGAQHVGGGQDLGVGHEHAPEGSRMTAFAFGHCSSCRVSLTGLTSRSDDNSSAPGCGAGRA